MLRKIGPQARLGDQLVRREFHPIDPIKQLADAKPPRTVLTDLRGRRVPIRNRSVQ
jgi:hypothetical protein